MIDSQPKFRVCTAFRKNVARLLLIGLSMCCYPLPASAQPQGSQPLSTQAQLEQLADMNTTLQAIFGGQPPEKYQALKGNAFTGTDGTRGYTLLMANSAVKTWAFVLDVRKAGAHEGALLTRGKLKDVANLVLTHYMAVPQPYNLHVDLESLDLPSERRGIARLMTYDADGFIRPEVITRLHYASGRTVVLLLGLPGAGVKKGRKQGFDTAYDRMENEAKRIILHTGLADTLTPSEHYMLWRLRQIFW